MFNERLEKYREELDLSKRQFAKKLNVSESYYNMFANGKRNPSKNFILKLVKISHKPEEYWIYGINEDEYTACKDEFKNLSESINVLLKNSIISSEKDVEEKLFKSMNSDSLELIDKLLITALKADIEHLINKHIK